MCDLVLFYCCNDWFTFVFRLLTDRDPCTDDTFHSSCIELCGRRFVSSTVFSQDARPPFLLLRQTINSIVECVESGGGRGECV